MRNKNCHLKKWYILEMVAENLYRWSGVAQGKSYEKNFHTEII